MGSAAFRLKIPDADQSIKTTSDDKLLNVCVILGTVDK